jgi:hypothetical protein
LNILLLLVVAVVEPPAVVVAVLVDLEPQQDWRLLLVQQLQ